VQREAPPLQVLPFRAAPRRRLGVGRQTRQARLIGDDELPGIRSVEDVFGILLRNLR
jgi:hypothetical protein